MQCALKWQIHKRPKPKFIRSTETTKEDFINKDTMIIDKCIISWPYNILYKWSVASMNFNPFHDSLFQDTLKRCLINFYMDGVINS